jgi:Spy/CpxP family protein refolding chaperone
MKEAMNRRQMLFVPGAALAVAGVAEAQSRTLTSPLHSPTHKVVSSYSGVKSYYAMPRSATKQSKYLTFLTAYLSLTTTQSAQIAAIMSQASASDQSIHQSLKTARQNLADAVKYNDGAAISQASAAIGALAQQRHTNGANANAALYQVLTAAQQTALNEFRG